MQRTTLSLLQRAAEECRKNGMHALAELLAIEEPDGTEPSDEPGDDPDNEIIE